MPTENLNADQFTIQPRALSMWQPWASLLAHGIKTIETRGKDIPYRGQFYIHATGNIPRKESYEDHYIANPEFLAIVHDMLGLKHLNPMPWKVYRQAFPTGQLIGRANLIHTRPTTDVWAYITHDDLMREETVGIFGPTRWAWIIDQPEVLSIGKAPLPPMGIPIKGNQSLFWRFDPAVLARPIHYMQWDGDFYQI